MTDLSLSRQRAGPFPLKRILVLCDASDAAENAAWRAGLLAREHGAWLRILHVRAWHEDAAHAQARLDALAWRLQEHLRIAVVAQALRGGLRRELTAAATEADLLVTRASPGRWTNDWLAGIHPDRLVRLAQLPALVVRKTAALPYRRVLAGVQHGSQAGACIAAASGMAGGPHMELLAELGPASELLPHEEPAFESRAQRVEARIHELAEASPGARMKEAPCVVFTRSAAVLLEKEQALFPDLVVVARSGSRLPRWIAPSLPRHLLARTGTDLLILPAAPMAPSASGAQRPPQPALGAHGAKVWPS